MKKLIKRFTDRGKSLSFLLKKQDQKKCIYGYAISED